MTAGDDPKPPVADEGPPEGSPPARRVRDFFNTGIGAITAITGLVGAIATGITVMTQTGIVGGGGSNASQGALVQPGNSGTATSAVTDVSGLDERRLLALIPPDVRSSCFKTQPKVRATGAIASWQCYPPVLDAKKDGVQYDMFSSRAESDDYFRAEIVVNRPARVSCGALARSDGTYSFSGTSGEPRGQISCFRDDTFAWIAWTDDSSDVFARAWRADRKLAQIAHWWRPHVLG